MPAAPAPVRKAPVAKDVPVADAPKEEKKDKKEKAKRTLWGDRDENGKLKTKLPSATLPDGYDTKTHLPLRRSDFSNPADAIEYQAGRLEAKVIALRKRASEERNLGSVSDRAKARKMKSLFERFKKMETEFKSAGMTDEQIAAFMSE